MSPKEKTTNTQIGLEVVKPQDIELNDSIRHDNPAAFAVWVRALMQQWRQGTTSCKDRSEVNLTNKKPFKQKGTGRARAGTARSPLWRKGGVIFGPQPRTRTMRLGKIAKKGVLNTLAWQYAQNGNIVVLDWALQDDKPSASAACKALAHAQLLERGPLVFFVAPGDYAHHASLRNLTGVRVLFFDEPNAFDLARSRRWVVLKKDFDAFKEMVSSWN